MSDESDSASPGDAFEAELHDLLAPSDPEGADSEPRESRRQLEGSVDLGPFTLETRIGVGGMGEVYRGEHRQTEVPVAVKVIRATTEEQARRRFQREVQAHAGLVHPGVSYLFEYGEIGDEASAASGGVLEAGSPYVAMELADRGTVRDAMPLQDWKTVCRLLVQTLDALAYAHARGVIHKDLKPENLLVFDGEGAGEDDWRVKLADFGIAHAFSQERDLGNTELRSVIGTPQYMAPEQFGGEWRAYGPWTDLYALGCITWELVCGRRPFHGSILAETVRRHAKEERPPLEPQFPVPDELESWVHRAMAPRSDRRFRRAADALWALPRGVLAPGEGDDRDRGSLSENRSAESAETDAPTESAETVSPALTSTVRLDFETDSEAFETPVTPAASGESSAAGPSPLVHDQAKLAGRILVSSHPPLPSSWKPGETDPVPAPLVGAGLGLFGLRDPPFVDRAEECDRIWEKLDRVVEEGAFERVLVSGDAGTGKSRLARWITNRAHEVGAARVLEATHTSDGGSGEGLRGALEQTFRTLGLERREVHGRLVDTLGRLAAADDELAERDARALTEYLRPTDDDAGDIDGPRYRFTDPRQRNSLLVRVLDRLADRRPVVLWLDDIQWGPDALGVLEEAVDGPEGLSSVLVLATVRSDIVSERPTLERRLDELAAAEGSTRLSLEPLEKAHQRELLDGLLPLEDELAEELAERTEGHPLFAMQLLGHWIDGDELEIGSHGFAIPGDRDVELPENIHELWMERIHRLCETFPTAVGPDVLEALELAAALGREVDEAEWLYLSRRADLSHPAGLSDALVERGLARWTADGWAFAHGLLVDSLARRARRAGRSQRHHRRCAEMLEDRYPDHPRRTAGRRADHWEKAGALERALEPLFEQARRYWESGDVERARDLLGRRDGLLERLDIPADDPRAIEDAIERARCDLILGTPTDSVLETLEDARERAADRGDDRLLARAWRETSRCRRRAGDGLGAREAGRKATEHARRCDESDQLSEALVVWGWAEFYLGDDLEEAERLFAEARDRAREENNRYYQRKAKADMGHVAMSRGDIERAAKLFEESLRASREAGFRTNEGNCLNGLGEVARYQGDADTARERYRDYGKLTREMHLLGATANAHLNLALVELMDGRFDAAERQLRQVDEKLERLSRRSEHIDVRKLGRMVVAVGRAHWSEFDDLFVDYADGWPEDAPVVRDHPWLLEMAGDYAAESGEGRRAERAWELARDLWDELGAAQAVDRVDEKLEEIA